MKTQLVTTMVLIVTAFSALAHETQVPCNTKIQHVRDVLGGAVGAYNSPATLNLAKEAMDVCIQEAHKEGHAKMKRDLTAGKTKCDQLVPAGDDPTTMENFVGYQLSCYRDSLGWAWLNGERLIRTRVD